jgi:Capsule polysaccharide biosynthesis protein
VRVITHESGFQPFSGYFTEGDVTKYPISIPDVNLTPEQNARLDADMQKRWQGDFSMAGIQFWNEMRNLPEELIHKAAGFKQVVAIFSNVIFDTTQINANTVFADMFAWLDTLLEVFKAHPETFFVLRAHPDEARPGKSSRESVAMWFEQKATGLPNVTFIPPQERISSYELIRRSKFVLTYNSQIGLEAMLMGVPALGAAQAPFVDYDTVYFERNREAYLQRLESFFSANQLEVPEEAVRRIRRFIYFRYYRYSLPFGAFIESTAPSGYVRLKKFSWKALEKSPTALALQDGLLHGKRFELDD